MKLNMLFAVLVVGMTTVGSAFAQSTLHIDIPFDFSAENSMLPAGEYTVSPVFAGNNTVLAIRSVDGHRQIVVWTSTAESARSKDPNKLVFRRYGDQYFLSQIWVGGQALGMPVSDREREMAHGTHVQLQEASIRGK